MRLRKPCSLARWRFLGWNVGFPISAVELPRRVVRTAALRPIWLKIEWRASAAARLLALEYSRSRAAADERALEMTDFQPPGSATIDDFHRIDMRVGRIIAAEDFPRARVPAYRLTVDFGPHGTRRSSARLAATYPAPAALIGRLVIAVVNFAPRNIAGFESQVLVLGALPDDGLIPLLSVDKGAQPGDRIG
jgi:tRNA-binding protein